MLSVGAVAGSAYAYFSAGASSGAGQGSVGAVQAVTVDRATATVTTELLPGGTGTLELELTNPNRFAVTVTGVSQDGPVAVTGGGPGCTSRSAQVSVAGSTASGLNLPIAAEVATAVTVSTGATMTATSNTTCQGASFHIPVTVTVKS